jgi:ABC-type glycerol-3-phosphate transport system permease component
MNAQESMRFGMIIISALPVILLYAFVQKYFIKGVMVGSLKG